MLRRRNRPFPVPEASRDPGGMSHPRTSMGILPDDLYIE
jgi:hypothetical protein